MNISVRKQLGTPVTQNDQKIGSLAGVLFHRDTGKVLGINVAKGLLRREFYVWDDVLFQDHEWSLQKKSQSSSKQGVELFAFKVVTEDGQSLGRVRNVLFNAELGQLTQILVYKGLFGKNKLLIERTSIIEILRRKIIVRSTVVGLPVEQEEQELSPVLSAGNVSACVED